MPGHVRACSVMPIWCCQGAVKRLRCCQGAVKKSGKRWGNREAEADRGDVPERDRPRRERPASSCGMAAVTGLGLRCLRGGAKTWIYVYRGGGGGRKTVSQTLRLGSWPEVSVDAARKAAQRHAGAVAHGRDPAAERREERRRERRPCGSRSTTTSARSRSVGWSMSVPR